MFNNTIRCWFDKWTTINNNEQQWTRMNERTSRTRCNTIRIMAITLITRLGELSICRVIFGSVCIAPIPIHSNISLFYDRKSKAWSKDTCIYIWIIIIIIGMYLLWVVGIGVSVTCLRSLCHKLLAYWIVDFIDWNLITFIT